LFGGGAVRQRGSLKGSFLESRGTGAPLSLGRIVVGVAIRTHDDRKQTFSTHFCQSPRGEGGFEMKLMSTSKKSIAVLMAIFMVAAVSTVSAFAISDGTYINPTLTVPSNYVDHVITYLGSPATVTVSGDEATALIPVPSNQAIQVVVYPKGNTEDPLGEENGFVTSVTANTAGYDASFVTINNILYLKVTGPADGAFNPSLTFGMQIAVPDDHGPLTATLNIQ
jgi:hypothetical protein